MKSGILSICKNWSIYGYLCVQSCKLQIVTLRQAKWSSSPEVLNIWRPFIQPKASRPKRTCQKQSENRPQKQITMPTAVITIGECYELVPDFVKMCLTSSIPIEKVSQMKPFLNKHCRQKTVMSIIVDETTDQKEKSVLNVILRFRDQSLLLDSMKFFIRPVPGQMWSGASACWI